MIINLFKSDSTHVKTAEASRGVGRTSSVALANLNAQGGLGSFVGVQYFTSMPTNFKDSSAISAWESTKMSSALIEHAGALPSSNPSTGWQFSWILSESGLTALEADVALTGSPSSSTVYIRYEMSTETATTYIWAALTWTLSSEVTFQHTWL